MAPEQPVPGIYRLVIPTPFAVGPVNCYLIDGPAPVLIDCGPPTPEAEAALRQSLAVLRVTPPDLALIVLTHHHPDHAGGLTWLLPETTAQVAGHPFNDAWLLARPADNALRTTFFHDLMRYCGLEESQAFELSRHFSSYDQPLSTRPIDRPLHEGSRIGLGGAAWQVLETPGHAGTSISLIREDGVTIAGDTLLGRISSNALPEPSCPGQGGRPSSMLAYRQSLHRLAELPLSLILPGHGDPFTGHSDLVARRLQSQEDRARRLLYGFDPAHETVYELTYLLFPTLPDDQLFLGLSEVLGHLDILEEQGLASHTGSPIARYAAV